MPAYDARHLKLTSVSIALPSQNFIDMKRILMASLFILAGFAASAQSSSAQQSKDYKWKARLRLIGAIPPSSIYDLSGTDVKASAAYVPELDFTYFFTKNLAAELILATTKHSVKTDNHGTITKLGSVWLLPPTLNLQYHLPLHGLTPYAGLGVNYTIFYGVKDDDASLAYKNRFGFSTQLGADIDISEKWFINIDVKKIFLKTDVTVNTATKLTGVKVDPFIVGIGIGAKF